MGQSMSRKTNSYSLNEDIALFCKIKVTLLCFKQPINPILI
jgi:hypothetical protein